MHLGFRRLGTSMHFRTPKFPGRDFSSFDFSAADGAGLRK
jgi:hypothetical protein